MEFTARIIEDRMEEAAITLRRLPNPPGSGPNGYGQSWPEYVRDAKHAYGYHEARIRVVPSAADIQRMDECIDWLRFVHPDDARIVWLRAEAGDGGRFASRQGAFGRLRGGAGWRHFKPFPTT